MEAATALARDRSRSGEQVARAAQKSSRQAKGKAESMRMRAIAAEYRVMRLADANASAERRRRQAEAEASRAMGKAAKMEGAVRRLRRLVYGASAAAPQSDAFRAAAEELASSERARRIRVGRGAG